MAPAGLPVARADHVGCAQSNHANLTFNARWTGAAARGYPRVRDSRGNPIVLTWLSGSTTAGVYTGTYTIPAGWTSWFEGTWSFEFEIDAGRTHLVNVQVSEHCLNAPRAYRVDTSGTRTEIYDGSTLYVGAASRMVIETGNVGLTLKNHVLDPATQTLGTVFNATQPSPGTTVVESWSEAADAWDGRAYTSPDIDLNLTAVTTPCVNDGTHSFWLNPTSPSVTLPTSTTATTVATVQTDACSGVVGTTPVIAPSNFHSTLGTVQVFWSVLAGNETTGWPVQATPALANGMISDEAVFAGTGWPSSGAVISVDRAGATTCPSGERLAVGVCQPCPTHQACVSGTTQTQPWCNSGPIPADAPCPTCLSTEQMVDRGGTWVCEPLACPPGERAVAGACQPCPHYQVCSGGSLTTQQWCNGGNPPTDAVEIQYQDCVGGMTQTVTACLAPGDAAPSDSPCPACESDPALVSWWLSSSAAVELPENTDWLSGPTVMTTACPGGKPAAPGGNSDDSAFRFGTGNVVDGWATEVRALQATGEVSEIYYWLDAGWDIRGNNWYFFVERDGVTSCPTGQRIVGGRCEACPTYQVCSGGSLVSQEWCNVGNPPGDASMVSYQACQSGTTVSLQACVDDGGTAPANTPCLTSCPTGQRLISGACEACPTYQSCTASTGDRDDWSNRSFLVSRTFCDPGNPPSSAYMTLNYACVSGDTELVSHCIGEGGLSYNPGDQPCSGHSCFEYDGCDREKGWSAAHVQERYRYCGPSWSPPTRQIYPRTECLGRGYSWEYDETAYYCVGVGGLANASSIPDDDPCDAVECTDYIACTGTQRPASLNASALLDTVQHCDTTPVPADAYTVIREVCNGGYEYDYHVCIGLGGHSSDPGDESCGITCPSGQRLVGSTCQPCPTYYACNGNNRVQQTWCNSGSPPADAQTASFQSCSGGTTVTTNTCVPPGGSAPADDPCPNSCAADERLVGGTCEPCPTYESCSGNNLVTLSWCNAGDPPADSREVSYQDCQGGSTVTLQACLNPGQSAPADNPCSSSCPAGERLVSGRCETCPSYEVCFGNGLATRNWCNSGGPPADARTNTYQACVGGSTVTEQECLNPGDSPTPDSPCTSCPPGQELVSGSCVPCSSTETYCSGGVVRTRTIADCSDRDSRPSNCPYGQEMNANGCCVSCSAEETYCDSSGVERTRTIAGCSDRDSRPSNCPNGQEMNSDGCCVPCSSTETYCDSNGVERTRTIVGCSDLDSRSATETFCNGSSVATRSISGTCTDEDNTGATRYTCSGLIEVETDIAGCVDDDQRTATETYCDGSTKRTRTISGTCFDQDRRSLFCPEGQSLNADLCFEPAAACPAGEVAESWMVGTCSWYCVVEKDPPDACSAIAAPTRKADCTAPNQSVLPAHGFRIKDDGWYSYRTRAGLGLGSGGTVLPGSESLCIPCDGTN